MEVVVPCNKSAQLDISSGIGSSIDPCNPIQCSSTDPSMNNLNACLTECLKIEKNDIDDGMRGHECGSIDKISSNNSSPHKCLSKCATFPLRHGPKSTEEDLFLGEEENHIEGINADIPEINGSTNPSDQQFLRSISLPVPLKLVSAMKGSREKQGLPPKKLSVTWAPDVYDPIPTSVSHVPSNMNQRHRNDGKKSGKYKKGSGKSLRGGSKGKDKKQGRKNGGDLNKLKPFHGGNGVVDFGQPQVGTVEFNVREPRVGNVEFGIESPNSSCERSFLKTSVTSLHFPAAEAT